MLTKTDINSRIWDTIKRLGGNNVVCKEVTQARVWYTILENLEEPFTKAVVTDNFPRFSKNVYLCEKDQAQWNSGRGTHCVVGWTRLVELTHEDIFLGTEHQNVVADTIAHWVVRGEVFKPSRS